MSYSTSLDSLLIEKSTKQNLPYLRMLKESIMTDTYKPPIQEDSEWEAWKKAYCSDDFFEQMLARDDASIYHIGSLRDPAGMMVLFEHDDVVEVDDLLVSKESQAKGVGRRLITCATAYAKAWKKKRIIVDIYSGNSKTEAFLIRHGFQIEGVAQNDLGAPMVRWGKDLDQN